MPPRRSHSAPTADASQYTGPAAEAVSRFPASGDNHVETIAGGDDRGSRCSSCTTGSVRPIGSARGRPQSTQQPALRTEPPCGLLSPLVRTAVPSDPLQPRERLMNSAHLSGAADRRMLAPGAAPSKVEHEPGHVGEPAHAERNTRYLLAALLGRSRRAFTRPPDRTADGRRANVEAR